LKAQLVVDQTSGKIICTAYGIGRIHDLGLLKNTKVRFHDSQLCLADKGYQGIAKLHTHSCIPAKKPRGTNLSTSERQHHRNLAQLRVIGEHINRRLKIFRILKEQYRNRRKRFGLRCNLISGLLNYELALFS
jgi:hypothetical protein